MEYRDVHGVIPNTYSWRTPAPASEKVREEYTPQWYERDYKTSYRNSKHYIRKLRPLFNPPEKKYFNFPITDEMKNGLSGLIHDAPSKIY